MSDHLPPSGPQNFRAGALGALLPVVVFLGGMIALAATGALSSATGGAIAFVAFLVQLAMLREPRLFQTIVVRGLKNDMVVVLLISFLLAGVMAKALEMGGLVNALMGAAAATALPGWLVPAVLFLLVTLMGLATGTSAGTVITALPILLPVGLAFGVPPALAIGAIVGGAMFGDNIAPVSDTTIASAMTQDASVARVVTARLRYAAVAGALALIGYVVLGFTMVDADARLAAGVTVDANPWSFALLIGPAVILVLMLKGADIISALSVSATLVLLVGLATGTIRPDQVLASKGVIVSGFTSMIGIFPFFLFIFCLIEGLRFAGAIEWVGDQALRLARTPRSAELVAAAMVAVAYLATAVHAISVVVSGPIVRTIMKRFDVDRARGANIIDCVASGLHGIAPHSGGTIIVMGIVATSPQMPKGFAAIQFLPFVLPSIFLLLVILGSIITGWGRHPESELDATADAVGAGH